MNKVDKTARLIKYGNIPLTYKFDVKEKRWIKRERQLKHKTLGRIYNVSPKDRERFHLKLLLNRVTGATSFKDLRIHNGIVYDTYEETAKAFGLIENDNIILEIFKEAIIIMKAVQLRKYFAWFLIAENIQGRKIWNKFKNYFCDDFKNNRENKALSILQEIFESEQSSCKSFGLPEPEIIDIVNEEEENEIATSKEFFNNMYNKLNLEQKFIFENIVNNEEKMYFIIGPGGTGKTFLYKTIIFYYLSIGKKILSMAWTGIAAILLPHGMTSHRTFRLPLNLEEIGISMITSQYDKKKLREADLIIWDEASMISKKALEIIDKTLRDLCNNNIPFGNKLLILGGDFRQILPVQKRGTKESIIQDTIKFSKLWPLFKIMELRTNIRTCDEDFSKFLLKIGNGEIKTLIVPDCWKTNDICKKIYKNINTNGEFLNSAILACHNEDTFRLNKKVLKLINGNIVNYYSLDKASYKGIDQTNKEIYLDYPIEILNKINNEGLPPHKLELKIGAIVMLIRNLNIKSGLCNGTRLQIIALHRHSLEVKIITGDKFGELEFIPRITLSTGESSSLPFILYRKQFPVILGFAMTINKSQGQTFNSLGLYYRRPLFAHGQLYVALSRCKNYRNIFIENVSDKENEIDNIVWQEIFE